MNRDLAFATILIINVAIQCGNCGLQVGRLIYRDELREAQQIAEQCLYQVEHVIEVGNDLLEQCQ